MPVNPKWRRYLRFFVRDVEADIQDELAFHIETKEKEFLGQGCAPDEAHRRAVAHFGDIKEVNTLCRQIDKQRARKMDLSAQAADSFHDLRKAVRALRHSPGFTCVTVLTLAAGIGGATSLFSLVDAWIIHSVRFPQPERLLAVRSLNIRQGNEITMSAPDFADLKERTTGQLESMSAWAETTFTLSLLTESERIPGVRVTPEFFSTLGVQPAAGRAFRPEEGEFGRHRVAVVSHGFWKARLQSDASAVGSIIYLDGEPYAVIGVLPENCHFTLTGRSNVWVPLAQPATETPRRQVRFLQAIARTKPGVTWIQAREALVAAAAGLASGYPDTNRGIGASCITLQNETGRHTGESVMWVIFALSVGLLLIACSNVGNLLLVRAQARQRQASIQMSLGAGRGRLVRSALIETLVLFVAAAILVTALATWLTGVIVELIPFENRGYLPGYGAASVNGGVLLFALGISLVTGLLFGLTPAFESTRANVVAVLKESGSSVSQSARVKRLRFVLVVSQIALAAILVSSTVLLVREFRHRWTAPIGFEPHGVLTFNVSLNRAKYPDDTRQAAFFENAARAVARGEAEPAAISRFLPFSYGGQTSFRLAAAASSQTPQESSRPQEAGFNAVSPSFFGTLGIPVLAGRGFTAGDTERAPLVAVVSDALVKRNLPNGASPLGVRISLSELKNREAEIVGVVPEIRESLDAQKGHPQIYVPFAQKPGADAFFLVKGEPGMLPEIRKRVAALDPMQPVYAARTFDDSIREEIAPFQIVSGMLAWFGATATILATIGVYGVVAYSASQRTREIGIRAALGADRPLLVRIFLRQGLVMLQAGMIPGLLGGLAASMALRSVFAELTASSAILPLAVTALALGLSVFLATLVPAWKASSADPLAALRYDG